MATYYRHDCGHTSLCEPWKTGPDLPLSGLCSVCLQARIGEVITFARHGTPPVSSASRNHRDQTAEEGVSVYEVVNGEIQYCGWYFAIANRPLYRGTGRIVGWGSDGEPLVQILTIAPAQE
jgi:hypothetical protein